MKIINKRSNASVKDAVKAIKDSHKTLKSNTIIDFVGEKGIGKSVLAGWIKNNYENVIIADEGIIREKKKDIEGKLIIRTSNSIIQLDSYMKQISLNNQKEYTFILLNSKNKQGDCPFDFNKKFNLKKQLNQLFK